MMDLLTLIVGVTIGTLAASAVMLILTYVVVTNKKFMRVYMKWVMKMSNELTNEMFMDDDEE